MPTGQQMLDLARTRIGQTYVNILVPKDNPDWQGPWDCAEFLSWLVYQTAGFLYGCVDNQGDPSTVEAYTGAWRNDAQNLGIMVPWEQAASTIGGVLLRYPPGLGKMGHIALSDGAGGTVEAMGTAWGVRAGRASGRHWDTGLLLPGFDYADPAPGLALAAPAQLYRIGQPPGVSPVVRAIQQALAAAGCDPGAQDGVYGAKTAAAVAAFQALRGLVVDGQVGPQTAERLGVALG